MVSNGILADWLIPILIIVGGSLIGFIFKKVFHVKLKDAAKRSKWKGDDVIIIAIESQILLWFVLFSVFVVLNDIPLSYQYKNYFSIFLKILLIASFTQALAKLIDGLFNYQSTRKRTRHNSVVVSWNDPEQMYKKKYFHLMFSYRELIAQLLKHN